MDWGELKFTWVGDVRIDGWMMDGWEWMDVSEVWICGCDGLLHMWMTLSWILQHGFVLCCFDPAHQWCSLSKLCPSAVYSHQFSSLSPVHVPLPTTGCFWTTVLLFFKKIFLLTFSSGLVWVMFRTVLIWKTPKISSIDQHLVTVVQRKAVLFSVSWPFEH